MTQHAHRVAQQKLWEHISSRYFRKPLSNQVNSKITKQNSVATHNKEYKLYRISPEKTPGKQIATATTKPGEGRRI